MTRDTGTGAGMAIEIPRTRWGAVVAVSLAIILAALDLTIVAVALPLVGADLDAPPAVTQWVLLAYFLPMTALGIPAGRWVDRAGLRPAFALAVAGFAATSALIALAPTLWLLLAGRALQGAFGSLVAILGFPVVATVVRPEHRGRAMGLITTLIPLSGLAGPGLGGWVAATFGWRAVFAINIPIAVATLGLGLRTIPAGRAERRGLPLPDRGLLGEALLLGGAVGGLFLALDQLGAGRATGRFLVPAGLALAAVAAGVAWSRLPTSRPVITLTRSPAYGLPVAALLLMVSSTGATYFLVPYLFADVLHRSAALAGATLVASAAGMALASPLAGLVADRVGARPVAFAGSLVNLAGLLALLQLGAGAHPADVAWRLALLGIGNGLFAGPVHALLLEATPPGLVATSGGVTALFRTFGFAIGPAAGALSWTLSGGGMAGFRTGVAVMTTTTIAAVAAIAALTLHAFRPRRQPAAIGEPEASDLQPAA